MSGGAITVESPDSASRPTPHYKITPRAAAKLTPRGYGKAGLSLFDNNPEASAAIMPEVFGPRSDIKRLEIEEQVLNRPLPTVQDVDRYSSAPPITSPISKVQNITEPASVESSISRRQVSDASLPVIDQPDYYVRPDLVDLARMSEADLSAVQNFEVGRRGFGRVKFLGPVDVRGVRINDIFVFNLKSLVVYPDDSQRPPAGQGFNRACLVTLENVFPVNRGTKERIVNPRVVAKFEQKLRDRPGLQFVSYNSTSGEWSFVVQSFDGNSMDNSPPPPLQPLSTSNLSPKSPHVDVTGTLDTPQTTKGSGVMLSPPTTSTPLN